jgi:ribosome-associated heat shock protein Hsp15
MAAAETESALPAGATTEGRQRADRWLWAARFFKTRARARDALVAGKVEVNGARAKPARPISPGDRLQITTPTATYTVNVRALHTHRRPAAEARCLYTETPASVEARAAEAERRRARRDAVVFDQARPDRRERRAAIRFRKQRCGHE